MRTIRILPLLLLAACAAPTHPVVRPPSATAAITLSSGSSEWGYAATEVYADDTVIQITRAGVGQRVDETARTVPGAYDRVAAVLRAQGPGAVRATDATAGVCPGSQDAISADPPLDGFAGIQAPCGGDDTAFRALLAAALRAIAPPG